MARAGRHRRAVRRVLRCRGRALLEQPADARPHWGHGYATEALDRLLRFAFDELDLHRLEADVDPRNARSIALLDRLGFRREGVLRERWHVAGEIADGLFYGLLAHEWRARS